MITREQAWDLLKKYNKEPFHQHHAVTVEGVMRYYAEKKGYDPDFWGLCGLLHDIDFEMWPEEHCVKAPELLAEIDTPEEIVHAVCSHGYGICSDVEPVHDMEKFLFAADELTGLIGAAIILRPSHSCKDMDVKSVKKKFKDKHFAAKCNREVILQGCEMLGMELRDVAGICIEGMKDHAAELDLLGTEQ
jgi:predicted hydrolase (HD superfamily)